MPAAGPAVVRRESLLEVAPATPWAAHLQGWARDEDGSGVLASCRLDLECGQDAMITALDTAPLHDADHLLGASSQQGLRRHLAEIAPRTPDVRLLLRLLDDAPILSRVAMQAQVVDHPAVALQPVGTMSTAGADQCEGWQSGGVMMRQITTTGRLRMALSAPVDDRTGPWAGRPVPVLPAWSTRRRRRVEVTVGDDELVLAAHFRDSYADPDGVERGLHGYVVRGRLSPDLVVRELSAQGVVLPWPECWAATGSADRLVGRSLAEVDAMSRQELVGLGTCTHLTDTFRTLQDVGDLAALL